ncbi:MAG: hypothetical protein SFW36_08690 [Leptolyngbyaceae cyanobacterium bins.59]|nr:hypothetical protein [Leptolyngbyaceae cyanobacterium bins.59]
MVLILIFVIALVAWALHLMQQAIDSKEFSLMLAGFLVASAAAAMMAVYFLMGHYMGYVAQMSQSPYRMEDYIVPSISIIQSDTIAENDLFSGDVEDGVPPVPFQMLSSLH